VLLFLYLFVVDNSEMKFIDKLEKDLPTIIYYTVVALLVGMTGSEEILFWFLILTLLSVLFLNYEKLAGFVGGLGL
jgi:hypothetical protein